MIRLKRRLVVNGVVPILVVFIILVLSAGAQAETWEQVNANGFGDPDNQDTIPLRVFKGYLYAGTWNSDSGGELWRTANGSSWELIPQSINGFGDANNWSMWPMAIFDGNIYAASEENTVTGGEVWRSSDGLIWEQDNEDGFGDTSNTDASWGGAQLNGYLYTGTAKRNGGGEVWRTDGTTWTQVNEDGFGDSKNGRVRVSSVFDGYIYAGTGNGFTGTQVWRSSDGTTWTTATPDGFGNSNNGFSWSWTVLNGCLYSGTQNGGGPNGGEVWRTCDGTTWARVVEDGFDGDSNNWSIKPGRVVANGYLYAATWNGNTGGEVWRSSSGDIGTWTTATPDGFGDSANQKAHQLVAFRGRLYTGTGNAAAGGEVWALSYDNIPDGSNVSADLASGVSIGFSSVLSSGSAVVDISNVQPADEPSGFSLLGTYYNISTNATHTGDITITIPYDESEVTGDEEDLELFHWNGTSWDVVPATVDTAGDTITGKVTSLSIFAAGSSSSFQLSDDQSVIISVPSGYEFTDVSVDPSPVSSLPGIEFPFGTISYTVNVPVAGDSVATTLVFANPLPDDMVLYKVDEEDNKTLIPQSYWSVNGDRTELTLTLTDGGDFDADNTVNGVIVDPLTLGVPISAPATGMNTNWLTFLAFTLTLIGGYLVLRNRTDLFRPH